MIVSLFLFVQNSGWQLSFTILLKTAKICSKLSLFLLFYVHFIFSNFATKQTIHKIMTLSKTNMQYLRTQKFIIHNANFSRIIQANTEQKRKEFKK